MKLNLPLLLAATIGLALYMELAVAGEGGFSAFLSHPPLIALTAVTFVFGIAAAYTKGNLSSGIKEDRGNRWILAAFSILTLLLGYLPAYTDRINFICIDGELTRWIGVLLYTIGGTLRIYPVFVLGHRFSGLVAIQQNHTLVTDGIYSKIRNPSYLGLMLGAIGFALAFRSGIGILIAASMLPPLISRMNAEERLLSSHFGEEYEEYKTRTFRLLPGIY